MLATPVRFYLDENMQLAIAEQLQRRGIEAVTVLGLGLLGDEDINHLERATAMNHVLCTHDADYIELAASGIEHTGIIFGQQEKHSIGDWVKFLELIHGVYSAEEMRNLVEYL